MILGNGHEVQLATFSDRAWARIKDPAGFYLFGVVILYLELTNIYAVLYRHFILHSSDLVIVVTYYDFDEFSLRISLMIFIILVINDTVGIGVAGQTLGKKKTRIFVVTRKNGETPSTMRAFVRSLISNITGATVSIYTETISDFRHPGLAGLAIWILIYLSAMLTKTRRGWHDKIAGTVVIKEDPK